MLFFRIENNKVVMVSESCGDRAEWISRHDFRDIFHAEHIARQATDLTGKLHIGVDNGTGVWPRYDVVEAPTVGDAVSYGFNGDSYPDGEIVSITPHSLKVIVTSTGSKYYRRKSTGSWKKAGGTWSLIKGTHNERNPHF